MHENNLMAGLAMFLGVGFITGLRSMTGPAVIAWAVYLGWLHPEGALAFVGRPWAVGLFTLLAVGEMIADKLPTTPNRTGAIGLSGRILAAAFCGAVLAMAVPHNLLVGMVVTAIVADGSLKKKRSSPMKSVISKNVIFRKCSAPPPLACYLPSL